MSRNLESKLPNAETICTEHRQQFLEAWNDFFSK